MDTRATAKTNATWELANHFFMVDSLCADQLGGQRTLVGPAHWHHPALAAHPGDADRGVKAMGAGGAGDVEE